MDDTTKSLRLFRRGCRLISTGIGQAPSRLSFSAGRYVLVCALLSAYLVTLFVSPWFHSHPEQNHGALDGGTFHAHIPSSASLSYDEATVPFLFSLTGIPTVDTDHTAWEMMHLGDMGTPPLPHYYPAPTAFNILSYIPKLVLRAGSLSLPGTAPSLVLPGVKTFQEFLQHYAPQVFVILIGTDLPPPTA